MHSTASTQAAFSSTDAKNHDEKHHQTQLNKRKRDTQTVDVAACALAGIPAEDIPTLPRLVAEDILKDFIAPALLAKATSKAKNQMAMQMRWFCFNRQYVSQRTFEGKHFRSMLEAGDRDYTPR